MQWQEFWDLREQYLEWTQNFERGRAWTFMGLPTLLRDFKELENLETTTEASHNFYNEKFKKLEAMGSKITSSIYGDLFNCEVSLIQAKILLANFIRDPIAPYHFMWELARERKEKAEKFLQSAQLKIGQALNL